MSILHTAPLGMALLGLVLGMRHATDPDHVIAVTTILSREPRISRATWIGLVWGLGHTATVVMAGSAIILFRVAIPVRFGMALDFVVALVLIILGIPSVGMVVRQTLGRSGEETSKTGLRRDRRAEAAGRELIVHSHRHSHGGHLHRHSHAHVVNTVELGSEPRNHQHLLPPELLASALPPRSLLKSFGIGLIHGLAGSSAIALLVLSTISQPLWAMLYLTVFCIGTVLGMGLITTAIAAPLALAGPRVALIHRGVAIGSGLLSFGFGLLMAWQIGFSAHLFAAVK